MFRISLQKMRQTRYQDYKKSKSKNLKLKYFNKRRECAFLFFLLYLFRKKAIQICYPDFESAKYRTYQNFAKIKTNNKINTSSTEITTEIHFFQASGHSRCIETFSLMKHQYLQQHQPHYQHQLEWDPFWQSSPIGWL